VSDGAALVRGFSNGLRENIWDPFIRLSARTENIVECLLFAVVFAAELLLLPCDVAGRHFERREARLPGARKPEDSRAAIVPRLRQM
jgi:hypothetical protein